MPKLSKDGTQPLSQGPGKEWQADLDGYMTSLATVDQDADLTPLLQGLPGDRCPSPHWGFVFKGSMWWRYGDHEEIIHAGEAFYAPPGHTAGATAGSEFLVFSPTEVMAGVAAHMMRRAGELHSASRG
jgi:hypothetical protein